MYAPINSFVFITSSHFQILQTFFILWIYYKTNKPFTIKLLNIFIYMHMIYYVFKFQIFILPKGS